tara:strand:- start:73 stop:1287 length:1215 start_codon:yes stop_codon:yes gene_type:complete
MVYHFPKALEDTHTNMHRVCKAFKLEVKSKVEDKVQTDVIVQIEDSILKIDKTLWNDCVGKHGVYDWEGLKFLEQVFSGNNLEEHNWTFHYLIVYDQDHNPILATFLTVGLWKDDMLAKVSASKIIEQERKTNPYYLTSKVLSIGSLFTEGNHLFIDDKHPLKQQALDTMMQSLEILEQRFNAKLVVLRDFSEHDNLHPYFQGQGFVRVQMPNSCTIDLEVDITIENYVSKLSSRNRQHVRKEILKYESLLNIEVVKTGDKEQLKQIQQLYANVHQNNLGLNTFSFPEKLFDNMSEHPNWEFITVSLLEKPTQIIGVMLCYNNENHTYVPAFVGMDYQFLSEFYTYRQLLYQTIKRAIDLKFQHIDLGMTASFEKRKLGATVEEKYAYIQTSDNYTMELMGVLE